MTLIDETWEMLRSFEYHSSALQNPKIAADLNLAIASSWLGIKDLPGGTWKQ